MFEPLESRQMMSVTLTHAPLVLITVPAPGTTASLNPQPLPPGATVSLNPQPLPPAGTGAFSNTLVALP